MELSGRILFHHCKLPSACFEVFRSMKEEGRFCDITFKFGNRSISAHRLVLAAAIPYFRNMFLKPEKGCELMDLILKEIHPHALESLIDFAYSCKILITSNNVKVLLKASSMLDIEEVREACCDYLVKQLDPQNVLIIRETAKELRCSNLVETCDDYVCQNFDKVLETDSFSSAPFYFIRKLLASDNLTTSSEEKVFQSVMRWVKKSPSDRRDRLPELLSNVRLALLTPDYLKDHVMEERYIRESIACRDVLDRVRSYHLLPHRRSEFSHPEAVRRMSPTRGHPSGTAGIYTICKEVKHKLLHLDTETGKWNTIETLPFKELGTVASHQDKIYFMDYDSLRIYTPPSNVCETGGNYCPARISAGAAVLNNKLYICGGQHRDTVTKRVEYFDLEKQRGVKVTSMLVSRSLHGVVTLGGYLYAVGGGNEDNVHSSVERFDPRTKEWSMMMPMKVKRYGLSCDTMGGKIYVCGGIASLENRKSLSSAEVYDPQGDEWKYIASMNVARYYCSLVAQSGSLYVIGGYNDHGSYLNSVEIYNPVIDKWSFASPMDPSHTNVRAVAIPPLRD